MENLTLPDEISSGTWIFDAPSRGNGPEGLSLQKSLPLTVWNCCFAQEEARKTSEVKATKLLTKLRTLTMLDHRISVLGTSWSNPERKVNCCLSVEVSLMANGEPQEICPACADAGDRSHRSHSGVVEAEDGTSTISAR